MTPAPGANRYLEPMFAFAIVGFVLYTLWFLHEQLYLPQPFFFNPGDFQMDWYNPAYFAHRGNDAYDYWRAVYPPLSFIFLKLVTISSCYEFSNDSPASLARGCDWLGIGTLYLFFFLNILICWRIFRTRDPSTALYRTIATGIGLPMLFGLERGNLVVVCFTFFALAYGNILHSATQRWLAAAIAINFKPYLLLSFFPYLLQRQLNRFLAVLLATVAVYLLTWYLFGAGSPRQLIDDNLSFAGLYQAVTFLDLWYPISYNPLLSLFAGTFPTIAVVGSTRVEITQLLLPLTIDLVRLTLVATLTLAFFRPKLIPTHRLVLCAVALAQISTEVGGYTQIYLLLLVFMEKWQSPAQKIAIFSAYLLALPGDIVLNTLNPLPTYSYFADRVIPLQYGVSLGIFLRPGIVLLMAFVLAADSLREMLRSLRAAPGAIAPAG